MQSAKRLQWSSSDVVEIRTEIRDWIKNNNLAGRDKMQALLGEIERHSATSPNEALRRFLLILFVLSEHAQGTPLKAKMLKTLTKMGETTLRLFGVLPKKSRLDFLYEDFHLILSQLQNSKGNTLRGAWEQVLALRCTGDESLKRLAVGSSALRLGHAQIAIEFFDSIPAETLPPSRYHQLLVKHILALRLHGDVERVATLQNKVLALSDLGSEIRTELNWEALCLAAQTEQKILPLCRSVRRGQPHHRLAYAVEAFLWSRAVASQEWITQFPQFRSLLYEAAIKLPTRSPFVIVAKAIEAVYLTKYDLDHRLRMLGDTLAQRPALENVQQELLLLAAGLRWLMRAQADIAATLWKAEYESLSLRLTSGASKDALGIFDSH